MCKLNTAAFSILLMLTGCLYAQETTNVTKANDESTFTVSTNINLDKIRFIRVGESSGKPTFSIDGYDSNGLVYSLSGLTDNQKLSQNAVANCLSFAQSLNLIKSTITTSKAVLNIQIKGTRDESGTNNCDLTPEKGYCVHGELDFCTLRYQEL